MIRFTTIQRNKFTLILQTRKLKRRKIGQAEMWTKDARWEGLKAKGPVKRLLLTCREENWDGEKLPEQRDIKKVGE